MITIYKNKVVTDTESKVKQLLTEILDAALAYRQWNEADWYEIKLICNELVANAVYHGNGGTNGKSVSVELSADSDHIAFRIADEGNGFDYRDIREPDDIMSESGRGLVIIKMICDRMLFNEKGNEITVIKLL